jgi:flagellar FliL protein
MAAEDKKAQTDAEAAKSDEAGKEGDAGTEGGKKKSLLPIIIVAVLVVGAAAGAGFYFLSGKPAEGEATQEEEKKVEEAVPHAFHDMPEMIINLSSPADENRFLKLKVTLELVSEEEAKKLEAVLPRVVDDFQVYLRELRAEDLQGSVGSYRLKQSLLMRANQSAYPVQVTNVLVREMLVQ